ncbi:AAA family ATPase [Solibacillus merdavium]|uniref:Nuclease SbcCD subunit C n=1 Tax=Solibacillus merdavium TaxID=2762218 RepID=A0ABR8XQN4_9BACL|nr:SMC family ATPase [Solibacillus merdavium]MBD8034226.1 SMC family ATPase [Solibacillus merdavium]
MKPIKLSMTAFGPYQTKEVIDFTKLHEHGIFVVSGATGAGKTTIFDAISFALYDSGSGEDREKSLFLRSDFADETIDTEVELEFEVRGRLYRIWRKFGQDGSSAKREFYEITGGIEVPAVEKFQVKLIQAKVEELIGLTYSQFNQIVMLPQGEFQKLLTSESKHKEEIFRKIFKTERFTKMVELLREKKKSAEKLYDQSIMQQDHTIHEIISRLPNRDSELFSEINQDVINLYQVKQALLNEQQYYEEHCKTLKGQYEKSKLQLQQLNETFSEQKLLNERIEKYLLRKTRLAELLQQEQTMQSEKQRLELAKKANQIEPLEREHEKVKLQFERAEIALQHAKKDFEKAKSQLQNAMKFYDEQKQHEPLLDEYSKSISQLEQLLPIYQSIDEQRKSVLKIEENQNNAKQLFEKLQKEDITLKEQQQKQRIIINELEEKVATYQETFEAHAMLTKKIELAREILKLQSSEVALTKTLAEKQQIANLAQERLQKLEQQIRSNHAAFLATSLHHGEACPVCGSTEHPAIHSSEALEVDDNELTALRRESDSAMQNFYQVSSKLEVEQAALNEKQQVLQQLGIEPSSLHEYEQQLSVLTNQLSMQKQQQAQLLMEKKNLEQILQSKEMLQGRIEKGQQYVSEIDKQYAQEKGKLEQSEKSLLPQFSTVQQVTEALTSLQQKYRHLKEAIQKALEALQNIQLEEKTCEVNYEHATKNLTEKQQESKIAQSAFESALLQEGFHIEAYKQALLSQQVQQQIQETLESYKQNVHTLTVQIAEEQQMLEGKELADLKAIEQQISLLNEQIEAQYSEVKLVHSYALQCGETLEKLEKSARQIEDYKEKLMQVEHVYDLIRGQNEAKISFERFAQIGYLEKVTQAANERLRVLSNGQYFLKSTGRKEGNAQSGLSIDVYDSNTGQTRDVKTLSGGEKFNASLSLALGMADVIQSVQGSVHIDTMFIDEGFGTLDEEALRRAIDILIDLQQTGRLIGVISHVAELKAAMPAILQVQKLKEGYSKTEIIIK